MLSDIGFYYIARNPRKPRIILSVRLDDDGDNNIVSLSYQFIVYFKNNDNREVIKKIIPSHTVSLTYTRVCYLLNVGKNTHFVFFFSIILQLQMRANYIQILTHIHILKFLISSHSPFVFSAIRSAIEKQ